MRQLEGCLRENAGWHGGQRSAGQLPDYRLADRLPPPRCGLVVIHQQVAEAQAPGGAKVQHPPTVTADLKGNDRVIRFEPGICLIDRYKPGSIECGNPVFRWPSRENLIIMDTMFAEVGLEFYAREVRGRLRRLLFTAGARESCK